MSCLLLTLASPVHAAEFGVEAFDGQVTADPAGTPYTQAGGHPYEVSTQIDFNRFEDPVRGPFAPVEPVKDILVDVPPGLVGNPTVVGKCSMDALGAAGGAHCPGDAQVGVSTVIIQFCIFTGVCFPNTSEALPVYSMIPPPDVPARFGLNVAGTVVTLDAKLRSATDYGLSVDANKVSEGLTLIGTTFTFWGVPADPRHDPLRQCETITPCSLGTQPKAFLTSPTACTPAGQGLTTTLRTDSWFHPGVFREASFASHLPPNYPEPPASRGAPQGPTGCDQIPFNPTFTATPLSAASPGPSGWSFDLAVPQDAITDPTLIAQGHLKKTVVTLPEGVRVSPSAADALDACSPAQIDLHGTADPTCPDSSKLGSVTIHTPLLSDPLEGSVYLATPHDNPSGTLLGLYLVAKGPGLIVKLAGRVDADPVTGQLSTTFDDSPQLPFSLLHLQLDDGPRAALSNPPRCGTYTTRAVLSSWSGKTVESDSSFTTSHDGKGAPCPPPEFKPGFSAGTENPVSGVFTPFSLRLQRTDDDSEFRSLTSLSLPPGLLASVSSISTRCTIEQADAHSCPADSHIGEVTTGAGAGSNPFYVGGDVYLTGPYKGNPFGIAVIVHALAGPFDLGYVVVKGAIQIHDDGSVTVATDPFPTILQGIPLQIRDVRVNLDRPGFMFNPTSCNPMSINGTVFSTDNQVAGVSSRFQVGECANLAFKPRFSASTSGKTSKANGASFHVHLASNEGPHGTGADESNIAKVDVQLPVSLPARLTTLQKACTAAQFASNPAGCPAASFVGSATAYTPILTSPLSGPAILVSHGGQAFPDLVLVLQGEGVRLNITGHTQIKKGITYSHFETVPDAPVASFDLTLPQGPHSALTTDVPGRNLCATTRTVTATKRVTRRVHGHNRKVTVKAKRAIAAPLLMPTTITAQNGAVIHQNTKIAVTGCAAVKSKAKKKVKARRTTRSLSPST